MTTITNACGCPRYCRGPWHKVCDEHDWPATCVTCGTVKGILPTKPEQELLEEALLLFPKNGQLGMMAEECAELAQASNKMVRGADRAYEMFVEEIADVEIMIAQMRMIFADLPNKVEIAKIQKLKKFEGYIIAARAKQAK